MKFLVSAHHLNAAIKRTFIHDVGSFSIDASKKEIVFTKEARAHIEPIKSSGQFFGNFHESVWREIVTLLDQLEEQPIVIEIPQHSGVEFETDPEINISQFTITFQ